MTGKGGLAGTLLCREMLCARKLVPIACQRSGQTGREQNDRARLWHFGRWAAALRAISLLLVATRSCAGA